MGVALNKDSIDLGIIVRDGPAALAFYRDFLGLEHIADTPVGVGGTMHRLMAGTSLIKVIEFEQPPEPRPAPGGLSGGLRIPLLDDDRLEPRRDGGCGDGSGLRRSHRRRGRSARASGSR